MRCCFLFWSAWAPRWSTRRVVVATRLLRRSSRRDHDRRSGGAAAAASHTITKFRVNWFRVYSLVDRQKYFCCSTVASCGSAPRRHMFFPWQHNKLSLTPNTRVTSTLNEFKGSQPFLHRVPLDTIRGTSLTVKLNQKSIFFHNHSFIINLSI